MTKRHFFHGGPSRGVAGWHGSPRASGAEIAERATSSDLFFLRAAARLVLAVDRLTVSVGRPPDAQTVSTTSTSGPIHGLLRRSLLLYSAGLAAIGAVAAFGLFPRPSALDVATSRSAHPASSRWAGQAASAGVNQPPAPSPQAPPASAANATSDSPPAVMVPALAPSSTQPSLPPPLYVNPVSRVVNLQPGRIDQGVDYAGTGPLVALGSGTIRMTSEAGWPGGAFIALELDKGPLAGRIVYYAENITPAVRVGQHVNVGDVVGILHDAYPNLEIGWGGGGAGGGTLGNALARSSGGSEAGATAQGVNFDQLLRSLGAPGA